MAVVTESVLGDALRVLIAESAKLGEQKDIMKGLIDNKTLPKRMGRSWKEPWFHQLANAVALVDGVEFDAPSTIGDEILSITPGEVGVQVMWTHRADLTITEAFPSIAADRMTASLARKVDVDLLGLMDGASTSLGGSTTTFTAGLVSAATSLLQSGRAGTARTGTVAGADRAPTPYYGVVHPYHAHDLLMQMGGLSGAPTAYTTTAMAGNFGGSNLSEANVKALRDAGLSLGNIRGAELFVDANLPIVSTAVKAGVFSKMFAVFVSFQGIQNYMVKSIDGRATRHTMWRDYGYGERADNYVCELHLDATAPAT
jgi:hypothetical protein